jgi:hypothetical protein
LEKISETKTCIAVNTLHKARSRRGQSIPGLPSTHYVRHGGLHILLHPMCPSVSRSLQRNDLRQDKKTVAQGSRRRSRTKHRNSIYWGQEPGRRLICCLGSKIAPAHVRFGTDHATKPCFWPPVTHREIIAPTPNIPKLTQENELISHRSRASILRHRRELGWRSAQTSARRIHLC